MFIGFVVAYGGFIWFYWLQSILKFNVLDLCFHGQPVGSDKNYFVYISTITADIWTKFGLHIGIAQ